MFSEFNCIVEGYFGPGRPTVEWKRGGGGGSHSGRVVADLLTFPRVAKSDEGEYTCSVTSADGRRAQEANTVLYVRDRGQSGRAVPCVPKFLDAITIATSFHINDPSPRLG